jgi:hypothetical protein
LGRGLFERIILVERFILVGVDSIFAHLLGILILKGVTRAMKQMRRSIINFD